MGGQAFFLQFALTGPNILLLSTGRDESEIGILAMYCKQKGALSRPKT